jgi:hypothetical protein
MKYAKAYEIFGFAKCLEANFISHFAFGKIFHNTLGLFHMAIAIFHLTLRHYRIYAIIQQRWRMTLHWRNKFKITYSLGDRVWVRVMDACKETREVNFRILGKEINRGK